MALSESQKIKIEEEENYRAKLRGALSQGVEVRTKRSRVGAVILAIFLGGFGIHKFYLGKAGWGIIYLLFSWTAIPMIFGFIEGIIYFTMSNQSFEAKYD